MFKSRQNSDENIENISKLLYERLLLKVYRYVNCWVKDTKLAEEVTLKVLNKALAGYRKYYRNEIRVSVRIFTAVRNEIHKCFKRGTVVPVLPGLSTQEQDVISLRIGAGLNNRMISKITGLSESKIGRVVHRSLCKLTNHSEAPV